MSLIRNQMVANREGLRRQPLPDRPCPKAERAPRPKAAAQAQQLRKSCRKRTNRDQLTVSDRPDL